MLGNCVCLCVCVCVWCVPWQVWIEFGRIQLPAGHHPNDIEKEWGKLIVAMLEREKSLRPEVERWVDAVLTISLSISTILSYFISCCVKRLILPDFPSGPI